MVGRICNESVRRKVSGKGGRSIASLLQGEGLCKQSEPKRSASVDEVQTDEVVTDEKISIGEVCWNVWRLIKGKLLQSVGALEKC